MQRLLLPLILLSCAMAPGQLVAQVSSVTEEQEFGLATVRLEFTDLPTGADAGKIFGAWGISLSGSGGSVPRLDSINVGSGPVPLLKTVLRNSHASGSESRALVIRFDSSVRRIGFQLGNFSAETEVSLTAFDPLGNLLGSIVSSLSEVDFLGVQTSSDLGIGQLVVSYGSAAQEEELRYFLVEYLQRPTFDIFLAQVGDGPLSESEVFQTTIVVNNLTNSTAQGDLRFFATGSGAPMSFTANGQASDTFDLTIPAFSSVSFVTGGGPGISVGYAEINSTVPVEATAVFSIVAPAGNILNEAGVGSATGRFLSVGVVQRAVGIFNSGIAVVNASDSSPARGTVSIRGTKFSTDIPEGEAFEAEFSLSDLEPVSGSGQFGPSQHTAIFLDQMFPELASFDFEGALQITSDTRLSIVILRTDAQGKILSSLPVGSTEK